MQLDRIKSVDWTHGSAVDSVPVSSSLLFSRVLNIVLCALRLYISIFLQLIHFAIKALKDPLQSVGSNPGLAQYRAHYGIVTLYRCPKRGVFLFLRIRLSGDLRHAFQRHIMDGRNWYFRRFPLSFLSTKGKEDRLLAILAKSSFAFQRRLELFAIPQKLKTCWKGNIESVLIPAGLDLLRVFRFSGTRQHSPFSPLLPL